MNITANKHYQQTHRAIMRTVILLLEQKELKRISVTEVCRELEINRSTFYEHFTDVRHVLEEVENEMENKMDRSFSEGLALSVREAFLGIFRHVREYRRYYMLFSREDLELRLPGEVSLEKFPELNLISHGKDSPISDTEYFYLQECARADVRQILRVWLERGCRESPDEIYTYLQHLSRIREFIAP